MAAVLIAGGQGMAALSHSSAAALYGFGAQRAAGIEVTRLSEDPIRVKGVKAHRRPGLRPGWYVIRDGIPVTSPVQTLIDLACRHEQRAVERFVNEADRLGLVRTDDLREALNDHHGERGVARLREILDRRTFRYTRSELERAFLPLVRAAGLPLPRTSVYVNGHEVDFYFPTLNLVVETDGLTYHPHAGSADQGCAARSGPHRGRNHAPSLQPRPDQIRAGPRPPNPPRNGVPVEWPEESRDQPLIAAEVRG